ncbi:MAG: bifunctional (p)ppGpp synthetase/guanosine-3',5'-bis(diphosphate) 3'-pyrophosphohydrolase [Alphaproteobacteria bacterium]|nr:MAG: bifunctional (p)ppGpp synthetase/guanosine-3',5'-bis(diphosphate) 3'-pyrophosphohydrolase [Alphaproteobacteria bacterium]
MNSYLEAALKNRTSRYTEIEQQMIMKAYQFAEKAHTKQVRKSGDRYIIHPVAVACLLVDMRLDMSSVVTGLLHDTVEDTSVSLKDIKEEFSEEIAYLVQGVTKLTKIELSSHHTKQAENFRKLVIAMSEDIRVLLIKLVDRLHNMQTLYHVKSEEKRRQVSIETMEIYAPLAERIGMRNLQDELQDLAFAELYPQAYESIRLRLDAIEREGITQIENIVDKLRESLVETGLPAEVHGRLKTPYSIWRKMKKKNILFEQISDVIAFRVIVASVADCYQALGAIHNEYVVVPGELKDYVSMPKPNHYQSLHTAVYFENKRIEVQIRTQDMHKIAEYGVAAHWEYKQNAHLKEGRQYKWLRGLLDILENANNPEEFLEHTKLEMFQDQVFCFTSKGDLISLAKGSTCIDFAYAVHSEVGNRCIGAKVNNKMMPLRTVLSNGDQVEIITSQHHEPSPTWERVVVTGKARASIRRYIRSKQQDEFRELGSAILKKACQQLGVAYKQKDFVPHLERFKCSTHDELCVSLGSGDLTVPEIIKYVHQDKFLESQAQDSQKEEEVILKLPRSVKKSQKQAAVEKDPQALAIKGLIPGMAIRYGSCCHPLPGDKIIGAVVSGKGITIHTLECNNLKHYENKPERLLDVTWDETEVDMFVGRVFMVLKNLPGALGSVSNIIGHANGNIVNLKILRRMNDFFDLIVDVNVQNVEHLNSIMASLRATALVSYIERK